jgi:hypothetical protein
MMTTPDTTQYQPDLVDGYIAGTGLILDPLPP